MSFSQPIPVFSLEFRVRRLAGGHVQLTIEGDPRAMTLFRKVLSQVNKRQVHGQAVEWCIAGPHFIAALRRCSLDEALEWLEANGVDLGGGMYSIDMRKNKPETPDA